MRSLRSSTAVPPPQPQPEAASGSATEPTQPSERVGSELSAPRGVKSAGPRKRKEVDEAADEGVFPKKRGKKASLETGEGQAASGAVVRPGSGQNDYTLTKPEPSRDDATGAFVFPDFPKFTPNLSPEQIIRAGSFGGGYFRPIKSKVSKILYKDDWKDMPAGWYAGLDISKYMTRVDYDLNTNKWKCKVGQSYDEWDQKGWILPQWDCRGWFHWYIRFWMGRRCEDDARQIDRWMRIASPDSGRWRRIYLGKYLKKGVNEIEPEVEDVSRGIRQTLLHWAYEPTTDHLNTFREEKGEDVANHADDLNQDSD